MSPYAYVSCFVALLALGAFLVAGWLRRRTLYIPAAEEGSAPLSQEAERKRTEQIRAKQITVVWIWFTVLCVLSYGVVAAAPVAGRVNSALFPTATATATNTPTITPTPTITNRPTRTPTPRNTSTPGQSLTLTLNTRTPRATPATATAQVIVQYQNVTVIQTRIVTVLQTVIVYQTVIVTPTFTPTPSPVFTETPSLTPTETASPTPTFTETPSPTPTSTP